MNNVKQTIILSLLVLFTSAFANAKYHIFREQAEVLKVTTANVVLKTLEISANELLEVSVPRKELDHFLYNMAKRESSNRHTIVNRWGYSGLFQFSKRNIRKFAKVSQKEFLRSPSIQRKAMISLMKHNRHVLRRQIKKYNGKVVHGVLITESGLLAGSHLAGPGNVRRWLRTGRNPKDALGTSLVDYIKLFSGYNLQSIK